MPQTSSRLASTLKSLGLALLNATLLLCLLCLLAYFMAARKMDSVAKSFAQGLVTVTPLKDEVMRMNGELSSLTQEIKNLRSQPGDVSSDALFALQTRLDRLNATTDSMRSTLQGLSGRPEQLITQAIETTAFEVRTGIHDWHSCTPPTTPQVPELPKS